MWRSRVVLWRKDDRNSQFAPSRPGGPTAGRAFVAMSLPIPAKTDEPNEPPGKPRDRHSYMARPPRRAKQPILIAVVANELDFLPCGYVLTIQGFCRN